jgi:hypothetical protein
MYIRYIRLPLECRENYDTVNCYLYLNNSCCRTINVIKLSIFLYSTLPAVGKLSLILGKPSGIADYPLPRTCLRQAGRDLDYNCFRSTFHTKNYTDRSNQLLQTYDVCASIFSIKNMAAFIFRESARWVE